MVDTTAANNYYDAGLERIRQGNKTDGITFLKKAAVEYTKLLPELKGDEREYIQEKFDDCLGQIRSMASSKEEQQTVGGASTSKRNRASFKVEYCTDGFEKVAGMKNLKEKIEDAIILPLTDPEFRQGLDGSSKGIIMYGPPGVGKTYMAKCTSGEVSNQLGRKIGFLYVRASDLKRAYVGETEENIRTLFETAAKNAPCILFFDEIQALCMSRTGNIDSHDQNFTSELLADFDIINSKEVLVMGATNYPHLLEPALFREDRFGETMLVEPPDLEARIELMKMYTSNKPISNDVDFERLAMFLQDYTAADIKKIANDAWTNVYKGWKKGNRQIKEITQDDLMTLISEVKPSIYNWVDKIEQEIEKGQVNHRFANDMGSLVKHINARRPKIDPTYKPRKVKDESSEEVDDGTS